MSLDDEVFCRGMRFRDADDAYDYFRSQEEPMTPRNAAGHSPEELSIQDAYMAGQRAGHLGVAAGANPYNDPTLPEYQAWERGRSAVESMRLADRVRAARMVA